MRQLVTIRTIADIIPIPDADAIEAARVDGWVVVVKKGEFEVGQSAAYFEIDSHVPEDDERFAFLMSRGVRESVEGFRGHVLKTVKLRGVVSQGLVLPLDEFPEFKDADASTDLAALINVQKWDPPLPSGSNEVSGPFPTGIPKTDEDRVQNLSAEELADLRAAATNIQVTEKLDGSSHTIFLKDDGTVGVAGRNWELSPNSDGYKIVTASLAGQWLTEYGRPGDYIQGEVYGEGVQANPLKIRGRRFGVFTCVLDGKNLIPASWPGMVQASAVPHLDNPDVWETAPDEQLREALVDWTDGLKSALSKDHLAEGIVIRGYDAEHDSQLWSFKVINNKFLLKQK